MLFERNGKSFQFCIFGLEDAQHDEVSRLIKENGGEIQDSRCPPIMLFTHGSSYSGEEIVFDVKYIYDCVNYGKLLDLINYKLGAPGYYGCLMSIFTRGSHMCSFSSGLGRCCTSMQIMPGEGDSAIDKEHNYAQIDPTNGTATDVCSDVRPPALFYVPIVSVEDFLYDGLLQNFVTIPNETTQSLQKSQFQLTEPMQNSQSPPERFLQDTQFESTKNSLPSPNRSSEVLMVSSYEESQNSPSPEEYFSDATVIIENIRIEQDDSVVDVPKSSNSDDLSVVYNTSEDERIQRLNPEQARSIPSTVTEKSKANLLQNPISINRHLRIKDDGAGPSRNKDTAEDVGNDDISRMKKTGKKEAQSKTNDKPYKELRVMITRSRTTGQGDEGTTMVSSTRFSDDNLSIDNEDSDSSQGEIVVCRKKLPVVQTKATKTLNKQQAVKVSPERRKYHPVRNYRKWEEYVMIKYLINRNMISAGKGIKVWSEMILEGYLPHRTQQSLNNHFRRHILCNLDKFTMESKHRKEFLKLVN